MIIILALYLIPEVVCAGILAYALATSKVSSKKLIKSVLIGTVIYMIVSLILFVTAPIIEVVMSLLVFIVVFCILGSRSGHKFNVFGVISLIAYLITLFTLPVISNRYEDTLGYQLAEGVVREAGGKLTLTQFDILAAFSDFYEYSGDLASYVQIMLIMFAGAMVFAIMFLALALLRKNTAQIIMGSIMSVFAAGMLYFDYRIFHSDSPLERLAGMALSKLGFSLSPFCIVSMLLAVLTIITAYICRIKEK